MAFPTSPIYKLIKSVYTNEITGVMKQTGNSLSSIPFDEATTDYQEYLKWLNGEDPYTEKGTPEAAD